MNNPQGRNAETPMPTRESFAPEALVMPDPTRKPAAKPKRKRASSERITPLNARSLAFLGLFPGASVEALSMLSLASQGPQHDAGGLRSLGTVTQELKKLKRLDAVDSHVNPANGNVFYSATEHGIRVASDYGYDMEHCKTLDKTALSRLNHYQMIAHVAAMFASPAAYFRDSLGIDPVEIDDLVSEHKMRGAYAEVQRFLTEHTTANSGSDFGRWRRTQLESLARQAQEGRREWSGIVPEHHELLTLGMPKRDGSKLKPVHQPDLAVLRDELRTGATGRNILVEVELSKKSFDAYERILGTFKAEFSRPFVYERVVYFTTGPQVKNLLKKVDAANGFGLFDSGRLVVLPIQHRNLDPVRMDRRVVFGGK